MITVAAMLAANEANLLRQQTERQQRLSIHETS